MRCSYPNPVSVIHAHKKMHDMSVMLHLAHIFPQVMHISRIRVLFLYVYLKIVNDCIMNNTIRYILPVILALLLSSFDSLSQNRIEKTLDNMLLDAVDSFYDILVAGSIAHADAFRSTKRCATYTSYVTHFEQVHSQIIGSVDGVAICALAKE